MASFYETLLYLYPPRHRAEFGQEMFDVFQQLRSEHCTRGIVVQLNFYVCEITGLLGGAIHEHLRIVTGFRPGSIFPLRRFPMQSNFRFPKSAIVLMLLILGGVVVAIEKARAIQTSLPPTSPPIGPIQPAHFQFLPALALYFLCFYAAGVLGWAVLFAMRRSGFHRLEMPMPDQK